MRYGRVFGVPLLAGAAAALAAFAAMGTITTLAAFIAELLLVGGTALLVITLCERALINQLGAAVGQKVRKAFGGGEAA